MEAEGWWFCGPPARRSGKLVTVFFLHLRLDCLGFAVWLEWVECGVHGGGEAMGQQSRISSFFQKAASSTAREDGVKRKEVSLEVDEIGSKLGRDCGVRERSAKRRRVRAVAHAASDAEEERRDSPVKEAAVELNEAQLVKLDGTEGPPETRKSACAVVLGKYVRGEGGSVHLARDGRVSSKFKERVSLLQDRRSGYEAVDAENGEDAASDVDAKDDAGKARSGRGGSKFTPLEEQYKAVKEQHPDTLLFVECGYKYRFFGEDAEIASKVLRIYCHMDRNFLTASVPTHRLPYHVERLVRAGQKVGVVRQIETAALKKAGSNKSGPFERKLTEVYTIGTLVADSLGGVTLLEGKRGWERIAASYIVSLYESGSFAVSTPEQTDRRSGEGDASAPVTVELVAVDVSTGELVYDSFVDNGLRLELEARLVSLEPVEILVPDAGVSGRTKASLNAFCAGRSLRFQQLPRKYFTSREPLKPLARNGDLATCKHAFSALYQYTQEFHLEEALEGTVERFSGQNTTTLSASVLQNFEIFTNLEDGTSKGTLYSFFRRTDTPFGARELRRWLLHPLISAEATRSRLDAVDELRRYISGGEHGPYLMRVLKAMASLPDLERNLARIQYQKCDPSEFWTVMEAFATMSNHITALKRSGEVKVELLKSLLSDVPDMAPFIRKFMEERLDEKAAKESNYAALFVGGFDFPVEETDAASRELEEALSEEIGSIRSCNGDIEDVKVQLQKHLVDIRKLLRLPELCWKQLHLEEFLVELPLRMVNRAGEDWLRVNQTKTVVRFRTPRTISLLQKLAEARERLAASAGKAWKSYLSLFSTSCTDFRIMVRFLSKLDVLACFARVAGLPNYCKPTVADMGDSAGGSGISISGARHPVAEGVVSGTGNFVPNDLHLGGDSCDERTMVITGPNMGGKSTYVRTAALLAIMAQVGSFVPADDMKLIPFDSFYVRIGASDNITRGLSTFMVELSETSEILRRASPRSLVVIDELGRGTSTHDGTAIAYSSLEYLLTDVRCITLFVTHYPIICTLQDKFPTAMGVFYMNHLGSGESLESLSSQHVSTQTPKAPTITFLYKLTRGVAQKSYGLNVAKLAQLPETVIKRAAEQAAQLEATTLARSRGDQIAAFQSILAAVSGTEKVADAKRILQRKQDLLGSQHPTCSKH